MIEQIVEVDGVKAINDYILIASLVRAGKCPVCEESGRVAYGLLVVS